MFVNAHDICIYIHHDNLGVTSRREKWNDLCIGCQARYSCCKIIQLTLCKAPEAWSFILDGHYEKNPVVFKIDADLSDISIDLALEIFPDPFMSIIMFVFLEYQKLECSISEENSYVEFSFASLVSEYLEYFLVPNESV